MAINTNPALRNDVIYSVFIRNHTEAGTFEAVIPDLKRIKSLGTDIIWLMPIHPIGEMMRKGKDGSPYAIKDFRGINPEYGTMEDFEKLVAEIRKLDMKVMIDVVYNHTCPDSVLVEEHPEWFYRRPNGKMGNKVGEWYDVVDLDYAHEELWDYQIETLRMWAEKVDGFRCDVASLVPIAFWERARLEVAEINPDTIWLAESVHPQFMREHRDRNNVSLTDNQVYQAFDMTYDYDVHNFFEDYLWKEISLKHYLEILMFQDAIYPANYIKMKFLENHDHPRFRTYVENPDAVRNWTAFLYFQKGSTLLYAGQEFGIAKLPSLFDKETILWDEVDMDLTALIQNMYTFKKTGYLEDSVYSLHADADSDAVVGRYSKAGRTVHGIFSLDGENHVVRLDVPDGKYYNKLDGREYTVREGIMLTQGEPILFTFYHDEPAVM